MQVPPKTGRISSRPLSACLAGFDLQRCVFRGGGAWTRLTKQKRECVRTARTLAAAHGFFPTSRPLIGPKAPRAPPPARPLPPPGPPLRPPRPPCPPSRGRQCSCTPPTSLPWPRPPWGSSAQPAAPSTTPRAPAKMGARYTGEFRVLCRAHTSEMATNGSVWAQHSKAARHRREQERHPAQQVHEKDDRRDRHPLVAVERRVVERQRPRLDPKRPLRVDFIRKQPTHAASGHGVATRVTALQQVSRDHFGQERCPARL